MSSKKLDLAEFITTAKLKAICPAADPDIIETILTDAPRAFPEAGLETPVAICHFISQIAAETSGLGRLDEDLSYANPSRLIAVFGTKLFPNLAFAKGFVRSPKKLANYVYAGRHGNTLPDDGWTFRGSGLVQLTGRGNYRSIGDLVGLPLEDHPELCREADGALAVALGYWKLHEINSLADDTTDNAVEAVTKRINPAMAGLSDRRRYFRAALKILVPSKPVTKAVGKAQAALETVLSEERVAADIETIPASLSGAHWVALFPTSRSIDDLKQPFRDAVAAFVAALRAGGATVTISATFRPEERAYLMHWSWMIAKAGTDPASVPAKAGVPIRWRHPTLVKSRQAARAMVTGYGIAFEPALKSRHTDALAIDMTISWGGTLNIRQKNGTVIAIATAPRNGSNSKLIAVGAGYGVIKLVSDPPHWSVDGH